MAGPPGTLLNYDIKAAIEDVIERTGGLQQLVGNFEEVTQAVGRAAGASVAIAGGSVEVAAAEDAGVAAVEITGWAVILIVAAILVVMRLVEHWLIWLAYQIPLIGKSKMGPIIKAGFGWIDIVENAVITAAEDQAKRILSSFRMLVFFSLGIDPAALKNLLGQTSTTHGAVTQAQVNHIQSEINYLREHLGAVTYVTQDKTVVTPIPQNLWDQIHHLEAQVYLLHKDVAALATQIQHAVNTTNSTQRQMQTLASEVHDIRAVSVGWADVEKELSDLGTQVTHFVNYATVDLASLHRRQTQLEPLTLLLQPGIKGLKNLRKLEDNMCQCPKIPGLPELMPDRLAIYEFLTNG